MGVVQDHLKPRPAATAGFIVAPLLYIIFLLGIAGAVLFTGYMQTAQSYSSMTASNAVRNELQLSSEIISARATRQDGSPPTLQTTAAIALPTAVETDYKRLPRTPAGDYVTAAYLNPTGTGSASTAGSMPVNVGARRLDPWGRLFLYCQWNGQQSPGTDASFSIISAGLDGRLETTCLSNAAATGSDDRIEYLTVANAMARSRTWQAQPDNTYRFGVDASSASAGRVVVGVDSAHDTDTTQQLNIGGNGKFGGNLTVAGQVTMTGVNAASIASSGDQTVGGNQTIAGRLDIAGAITNTGSANGGNVAVNDALYAYGSNSTNTAVKVLGSGVAAQPELAAYATAANMPIRLTSQGTGSVIFRTNNIDRMVVDGNGNVGIGTNTPGALLDIAGSLRVLSLLNLSDRRLKHGIAPIEDAVGQIRRLRGVRFTWNRDGMPSVGVIAQEVEQVFPELVTTGQDGIKAVMYQNLVAPLIEAVKVLADRVDAVLARQSRTDQVIAQLQADNAALQTRLQRLETDTARR